jgi:replicative DNA helicase
MRFVDEGSFGAAWAGPLFTTVGQMIDGLRNEIFSGIPPVSFPISHQAFGSVAFRPGEVLIVAGPPNNGKTALAMQWLVDALLLTPAIKALVVNVEMRKEMLIRRQLARISGTYLGRVMQNELGLENDDVFQRALATLEQLNDRLAFMSPPYMIDRLIEANATYEPDIVVVDYLQRIECCEGVMDSRQRLNSLMNQFRRLADTGACVVLVSAVSRTASKKNGGYDGQSLDLGSFRESSEIEYGADDAFILVDDHRYEGFGGGGGGAGGNNSNWPKPMLLKHVKSRNNERQNVDLAFDGRVQRFVVVQEQATGPQQRQFYGDDYEDAAGNEDESPAGRPVSRLPMIDTFSDLLDADPEDDGEGGNG